LLGHGQKLEQAQIQVKVRASANQGADRLVEYSLLKESGKMAFILNTLKC